VKPPASESYSTMRARFSDPALRYLPSEISCIFQSTSTYQTESGKDGYFALRVQYSHSPTVSQDPLCAAFCRGTSSIPLSAPMAESFATRLIVPSNGFYNKGSLHDIHRPVRVWSSLLKSYDFWKMGRSWHTCTENRADKPSCVPDTWSGLERASWMYRERDTS